MLHQAGQFAEFGQVFAQQPDLVHGAQDGGHVAALIEDFQERLVHVPVAHERPIHQRKLVANQLRHVGMQLQAPLLGIKKDPHQPARLVAKSAV